MRLGGPTELERLRAGGVLRPSWGQPEIFGVRRGITAGGQGTPVTLGYPESGHQDPEAAVPGYPRVGSAGPVRGFGEPHRNPATPRHGAGSPQEPHGRNGTLQYTCYTC